MRVLPIASLVLALSLPGMALAQLTDFKIYPGAITQFDQTCTSFTSRCALGGSAGELLQEYPMSSFDGSGNSTDFFRGIGEEGFPSFNVCKVAGVFYVTQDQDCIDQEAYDIIIRDLAGSFHGPNIGLPLYTCPQMTPPPGTCTGGPMAWGITVVFTPSPCPPPSVTVPCATSLFVGMKIANNTSWPANGQSMQGSWHQGVGVGEQAASGLSGGTIGGSGDPAAADAAQISWQITALSVVGQCGTRRVWDYGISVNCATLNMANIDCTNSVCSLIETCGHGGLYPSNTARGDGIALCVRDANAPNGSPVVSFFSVSPSPIPIPLVGLFNKSLWIGPSPFILLPGGPPTTMFGGQARVRRSYLDCNALKLLMGKVWFQSVVVYGPAPWSFTNAAATELDAVN